MKLIILSPKKEVFKGNIKSVKVPGHNGQFEVLSNHAPIVSALTEGEVRVITSKDETKKFGIQKGFIEVLNNEVSLLVRLS